MKNLGKTFKDIKKFDTKRNKQASREAFRDADMRTRVKPTERKEKGGGRNHTREFLDYSTEE